MNREIKFRVWDGEMHYELTHMLAPNGKAYPLVRLDSSDIVIHNGADDVTVMQYIGLKDKNGKEIYEGDICTFYWNPIFNEPSTIFELKAPVMFYGKWSSFCFEIRKSQSSGKQLEIFDELGDADLYVAVGSPITHGEKGYGVEVIGNIHENPELLK